MNSTIKRKLLGHLAGGVEQAMRQQDRSTGWFLTPEGGRATYRQDRIYPMALLYTREGTEWFGRKALLNTIVRAGDALRDFQDRDGRWEFIKPDGSSWGKSYMPWTIYHWLETFVLLRDHLSDAHRRSWAKGLRLCYTGIAEELRIPVPHNVPNWHGMSLVRGGQIFERPEWIEIGSRQCLHTAAHQHRDGYWPEGDGPTNGYNTIYIHALGLYHAFTGDTSVLKCLEKGCRFNATFIYPDGEPVETIDGRQNYESSSRYYGWPGFCFFAQGRRFISLAARAFMSKPCNELYAQVGGFIQHGITGSEEPTPWQKQDRLVYGGKALIRRKGPWFVSVSGYSPPPNSRTAIGRQRFIMSRSNCLSIWHERINLLIGGGNSKRDPLFSTFDVGENGSRRLEPDLVSFKTVAKGETIRFRYGKHACLLHIEWISKKALAFTFELPPATRRDTVTEAGFTMMLNPGNKIAWRSQGRNAVEGDATLDAKTATEFQWGASAGHRKRLMIGEGWSLEMPEDTTFQWPVYPYNPYAADNAAPEAEAVGAVSIQFAESGKRRFVLRID